MDVCIIACEVQPSWDAKVNKVEELYLVIRTALLFRTEFLHKSGVVYGTLRLLIRDPDLMSKSLYAVERLSSINGVFGWSPALLKDSAACEFY